MEIRSHYLLWRQQMIVWMELIWVICIIMEQITNEVLNYWKHPCYLLNTWLIRMGKNKELEYILIPLLRPGQKRTDVWVWSPARGHPVRHRLPRIPEKCSKVERWSCPLTKLQTHPDCMDRCLLLSKMRDTGQSSQVSNSLFLINTEMQLEIKENGPRGKYREKS